MPAPDLSVYFKVEAPSADLEALAARLREAPEVRAAYVKPRTSPAVAPDVIAPAPALDLGPGANVAGGAALPINDLLPRLDEAPPATPDFTPRQLYLGPAPGGIPGSGRRTCGIPGSPVAPPPGAGAWTITGPPPTG